MPGKNGYGDGTFIETRLFLSRAFISLGVRGSARSVSASSVKVLMMLLGKRRYGYRKHKGQKVRERTDGNRLTLTYKELEAHGISQHAATRSIDELLAKGFVSIVDPGGAFEKHKAVYAIEDDYRRWRPGDPPVRSRQRDVERGYQGKGKKTKTTSVNDGHSHARQRRAPTQKTRASTTGTLKNDNYAEIP